MSFRKQMLKGLKWSSLSKIGLAVFQLLQISILTRFLPKEAFGLIALAILVVNFTSLFVESGFSSAIFHIKDASENQYSSLFWLNIITSVCLYLILFLVANPISHFYQEPELVKIIRLLGLNLIFIGLGQQHKALLQKKLNFDLVTKVELYSFIPGLFLAVFLAYKGYGVYSLVFSTLITSFFSSLFLLLLRLKQDRIKWHFSLNEIVQFIRIGGFSLGSNIFDYFSRQVDIIIIAKFVGTEFLGVYSLAKQISLKAYSVMMPIIFTIFNPLLASFSKEKKRMENYYLNILYVISNITFPIYLCIALGASEILTYLYGADYKEGTITLIGLSIYQAFSSIIKPSGSLQIATGRTDIGFLWAFVRTVQTVLILFLALYLFDVKFVSLFLAALGFSQVFLLWPVQIKPITAIHFKSYIKQFLLPVTGFIVILGSKLLIDKAFSIGDSSLIIGFLKVFIGLSVYAALILIIDRRKIFSLLNLKLK